MNAKQEKIIADLVECIKRDQKIGQGRYEVKQQELTTSESGIAFLIIETGLVGDEGTYASIFARTRRHIAVKPTGGIHLLNAKRERSSRGFRNAVHSLTRNN